MTVSARRDDKSSMYCSFPSLSACDQTGKTASTTLLECKVGSVEAAAKVCYCLFPCLVSYCIIPYSGSLLLLRCICCLVICCKIPLAFCLDLFGFCFVVFLAFNSCAMLIFMKLWKHNMNLYTEYHLNSIVMKEKLCF